VAGFWFAAFAAGYLLGTFPSGYLFSRAFGGKDIRRVGSGNIGAANAFRNISPAAGILTLVFDMGKGFLAAHAAGTIIPGTAGAAAAAPLLGGLAAAAGYNYMPYFRFRGGKGVAVTAGALLAVSIPLTAVFFAAVILTAAAVGDTGAGMALAYYTLPLFLFVFFHSWAAVLVGLLWALACTPKFLPDLAAYRGGRRKLL